MLGSWCSPPLRTAPGQPHDLRQGTATAFSSERARTRDFVARRLHSIELALARVAAIDMAAREVIDLCDSDDEPPTLPRAPTVARKAVAPAPGSQTRRLVVDLTGEPVVSTALRPDETRASLNAAREARIAQHAQAGTLVAAPKLYRAPPPQMTIVDVRTGPSGGPGGSTAVLIVVGLRIGLSGYSYDCFKFGAPRSGLVALPSSPLPARLVEEALARAHDRRVQLARAQLAVLRRAALLGQRGGVEGLAASDPSRRRAHRQGAARAHARLHGRPVPAHVGAHGRPARRVDPADLALRSQARLAHGRAPPPIQLVRRHENARAERADPSSGATRTAPTSATPCASSPATASASPSSCATSRGTATRSTSSCAATTSRSSSRTAAPAARRTPMAMSSKRSSTTRSPPTLSTSACTARTKRTASAARTRRDSSRSGRSASATGACVGSTSRSPRTTPTVSVALVHVADPSRRRGGPHGAPGPRAPFCPR